MLLPVGFLAIFFFNPLVEIFRVSLAPDGRMDLAAFWTIATSNYYLKTVWFTTWQALLSTVLTLVLALPGAYVFARYRFPGKAALLSLGTLSFVLPTIVVATAFQALLGGRGLVNRLLMSWLGLADAPIQLEHTLTLVLAAHVFYNYALALRIMSSYLANQNVRVEESAQVLGASGWRLWWAVRLPLLRPALLTAASLVFAFTFTSFGVVLVLGGPHFATLEVEIYQQAMSLFNLPMAAALALVQMLITGLVMGFYSRWQARASTGEITAAGQVARRPATWREWLWVGVNVSFMGLLLLTPLLALVAQSLDGREAGVTLRYYALLGQNTRQSVLFVPPIQAVGNSVLFATVTTFLALALGLISAYGLVRRSRWGMWWEVALMLPLTTSAVTLGYGYLIALDAPPLNLRTSPLLIPLAHTLVALPFVVRSVLPTLRRVQPSIREAAAVLGATPAQVWWRVDVPIVSRGLVVGAVFAFTVSMGEFGASTFLARPDMPTMPIVIYRLLGQPGANNSGQAAAMSVILLLVSAVAFALIERLRQAGVGEF